MQTLDALIKYFSPIKCQTFIYLLIDMDFFNTCLGRQHFRLGSYISDLTTHKPIKIRINKKLRAKIRQPIRCVMFAFKQRQNIAHSSLYVS